MGKYTNKIVADFETTVYEGQEETEVWSAAWVELGTDEVYVSGNIEYFLEYLVEKKCNLIVWFHNLKFDGTFILNYLLNKGYIFTTKKRSEMPPNTFSALISLKRRFYNMNIRTSYGNIEFRDSAKLVPFSLRKAGEAFGTKHKKLEMEYSGHYNANCPITPDEMAYIRNDVLVLKEIMEHMLDMGANRLTIGSCALAEYKSIVGKSEYKQMFPNMKEVECPFDGFINAERYIRKFYKGAWCYAHKKGKVGKGYTYDVNGLYSYVQHSMSNNYYPIGHPIWFKGEIPQKAKISNHVYFVHIKCRFELKEGYLPTIQIKNNFLYDSTEWLHTSRIKYRGIYYDEIERKGKLETSLVELFLIDSDFELLKRHYYLKDLEIIDGCWFYSMLGIFDEYINKWADRKANATNKVERTISKLYLNNLYGKFAMSDDSSYLEPYIGEHGEVCFLPHIEHDKEPGYIPGGAKVTAAARYYTITHAQDNYDIFCYADTDSLHCQGEAVGLEIDDKKLGAWKCESEWSRAIFLRAKTYAEFIRKKDGKRVYPHWEITCAGMTEKSKELFLSTRPITDFKVGLKIGGKLVPRNIKGGVILEERDFTLHKK